MTDTTTPAASPSAAPAAAAAPASTVNDAAAALAFADSSLATPETPAVSTPAPAVPAPGDAQVPGSTTQIDDPRSPTIPRARFDEVVTARKTAEEGLKRYEAFKDLSGEDLSTVVGLVTGLRTDAVGATHGLIERLMAHPTLGPAMQAKLAPLAGRVLAGARGKAAEPAADPEPEADLQAQDGTEVYSAARQREWREWNNRQLTSTLTQKFEAQLRPLNEVAQSIQEERAKARATTEVSGEMTAFQSAHPEFDKKTHGPQVRALIEGDPRLAELSDRMPGLALEIGWSRFYKSNILPQQQKQSETTVLSQLQQRAVSATMNPGSASTSTPTNTLGDAKAALAFANQALGAA